MKFNLLKTVYKGILAGMPFLTYNPISQNTFNLPLDVCSFSTYLNFKLDDFQTNYLNNYIQKFNSNLEIVPISILNNEHDKHNYLSVNIYNCTSPAFLNNDKEFTRCEINTYVKDKKEGNYGTLIIDYLSNEFSMDPVNIFKFQEKVNFHSSDMFKIIDCSSITDKVILKANFSSMFDYNNILNDDLIRFTDLVYYKNGIFDKIYYDSSLVNAKIRSPTIVKSFNFKYKDLLFSKIDSIFYFTNKVRFIAGMWDNVYRI